MTEWTLESELRRLAHVDDVESALKALNVARFSDAVTLIRPRGQWERRGAETYAYEFDVELNSTTIVPLILKAFVGMPSGVSLEDTVASMMERREDLSSRGVPTPTLYYWGQGVWLEQRLPLTLSDYFAREGGGGVARQQLCVDVFLIALAVEAGGYLPITIFGDLMTDGQRVFMVDFGEDLGPPHVGRQDGVQVSLASRWLAELDVLGLEDDRTTALARARALFVSEGPRPA
jgi:hypothetical protein